MKRYRHYWWGLSGEQYPSRIAVLDCDLGPRRSNADDNLSADQLYRWQLTCCELRHGLPVSNVSAIGETVSGIWDRLSRVVCSRENTWVYMPNAGLILSAIGFWDRLENGQVELAGSDWREGKLARGAGEDRSNGLCVIEDPPTIILCQIAGRPGKLLMLDIRNYGIELLDEGKAIYERTQYYMGGLCDCLQALRTDRPVSLRATAASQAVQALRSQWDCSRLHCHVSERSLKLERQAIYGGRCECLAIAAIHKPAFLLDVRNMYPAICRTLEIPVSLRREHADPRAARRSVYASPETHIAHVAIRTDKPIYPYRRNGLIIYPVGTFESILAGPELRSCIRRGHALDVLSAAEYTTAPYLAPFYGYWLEKLTAARGEGKTALCQFIKRMMNGLIGKFQEPGRRWVAVDYQGVADPFAVYEAMGPDGELCRFRNIAGYTQMEEKHDESYWSCPSVGAWITSAGRSVLWNYIETAGAENVWYVDTDSLLCGEIGFDRLLRNGFVREGEIGHLRLVGRYSECAIYGIRDYSVGNIRKCAGVPRGEAIVGESRPGYWHRQRITSEIALGRKPGTGEIVQESFPTEPYRHGVIGANGRVFPIVIGW